MKMVVHTGVLTVEQAEYAGKEKESINAEIILINTKTFGKKIGKN